MHGGPLAVVGHAGVTVERPVSVAHGPLRVSGMGPLWVSGMGPLRVSRGALALHHGRRATLKT